MQAAAAFLVKVTSRRILMNRNESTCNNHHLLCWLFRFEKYHLYADDVKNYYKILGVEKWATRDEIKSRYLALVKHNHPDKQPPHEARQCHKKFVDIQEAYSVLSDAKLRRKYDVTTTQTTPGDRKENYKAGYKQKVEKANQEQKEEEEVREAWQREAWRRYMDRVNRQKQRQNQEQHENRIKWMQREETIQQFYNNFVEKYVHSKTKTELILKLFVINLVVQGLFVEIYKSQS